MLHLKKTSLTLILFVFFQIAFAQKNKKDDGPEVPKFGTVDKSDLEMKDCDFDEKAPAEVLIDDGDMDFIFGNGLGLDRRVRIKILNKDGLEWANVHITYRKGEQDISKLEAQTYNIDANGNVSITKVEKNLIYDKALNKKFNEKAFTFPQVKVGSIIEYKYRKSNNGLIDWYFQRSIPVRYSHFKLDFPQEIEVATIPYCVREVTSKDESTSTRIVKSFTMNKIPALRDEPYIINEDYYRDHLETKVTAFVDMGRRVNRVVNWLQVIKYLMEDQDFGVQITKNIPRTADLDAELKTITGLYERMKTIYKYVQTNMQWDESEGIWALDGVKSAWKSKKGTLGEINLILVNLLKGAGLVAHPVLVSTHDNGIVNTIDAGTYDYPGFHQFNKVMAYVTIDDQIYVLDATQKNTPPHLIPSDVIFTQGLVIDDFETFQWGWKQLWRDNLTSRNVILLNADIDEKGNMTGQSTITSFDYAKMTRLKLAKKGKDAFVEKYVTENNPNMTIDEVKFENIDADSVPLIQTIKFNEPLNASGDYKYFSINILTGLEKNPFVADNRFSDVFFGYKQSYFISGNFRLPEGYEFEQLPKNLSMRLPDTSIVISRLSQITENVLTAQIKLEFKKPFYSVNDYALLQEFYHKLFDILNEQIVIRKKKA
jgi:hypothetical protein